MKSVIESPTFPSSVTPKKEASSLPSLEILQKEAALQIANLLVQRTKLGDISTKVSDLITRYNAQKSYLGYAAQWYGEQVWWLQIAVSTVATGIAIVLYVPTIISIALSIVASFLLINHHQVSQERDRLISRDLNSQNQAVQTMLTDLETAKKKLEDNLTKLCELNIKMDTEIIQLRDNVAKVTQKSKEFEALSENQAQQISALEAKEKLLNQQLKDLEIQFTLYKDIVESSSKSFEQNNQDFSVATAQMGEHSKTLQEVTSHIVSTTAISSNSSLNSTPDNSQSKAVIKKADQSLSESVVDSNYSATLASQIQYLSPVVTPVKNDTKLN